MDYQLESLGDERFQQLCQALLVQSFPNVVCFPVGQPDGGRDAISYFDDVEFDSLIVFQVKYVKRPQAEKEPHKWLIETIKKELPKIKELIPRGAKKYFLITNVPGTAHLDVGSMDMMKEILDKDIPIPSYCWWRDDINRRLDGLPEIRWSYPELISGTDLMRQLIELGSSEEEKKRSAAIKAFLRDQYEKEREVKFKQVELQNHILDLFVDVPITLREGNEEIKHTFRNMMRSYLNEIDIDIDDYEEGYYVEEIYDEDELGNPGAASFFLNPFTQYYMPIVILEGAPGQGKSTITQYICQVHRMRLLGIREGADLVNESHKHSPVRFPIRVDLRDLATWLEKKDPFSSEGEEEKPLNWHKSLESFLSALIAHHSGTGDFSTGDLLAVTKSSSILLVFDGLDEIANLERRREVIDEIICGINRIKENCISLQVIITSRPAAFVNSPGFSANLFPHCSLESLSKSLITEYANKWIKARNLQGRESVEVKKILRDKISQQHLRDLAKNPMQLAILLSLIHNRGESLPDKRTELYDSYVELFLSREAQKSQIVREYRDLLVNIHRYLAWVLQSEVEEGQHRGSISGERLETILLEYLYREGHDTSLVPKLFKGVVERDCSKFCVRLNETVQNSVSG